MSIHLRLCFTALAITIISLAAAGTVRGTGGFQPTSVPPTRVANLREQLTAGLKATRVEQKTFIDRVVREVDQGRLERRLVNAIYVWSRRRWPLYPFPYFERAMRLEAAKRNVILPRTELVIRSGLQ